MTGSSQQVAELLRGPIQPREAATSLRAFKKDPKWPRENRNGRPVQIGLRKLLAPACHLSYRTDTFGFFHVPQ